MFTYQRVIVMLLLAVAVLFIATDATAADTYYNVPLANLDLVEGDLPTFDSTPNWRVRGRAGAMTPRVVLDGEGEAYVLTEDESPEVEAPSFPRDALNRSTIFACAREGKDISGSLYLPKEDWDGMNVVRFTIPAGRASAEAHDTFHQARLAHYQRLLRRGIPGAAWFRHQVRLSRLALAKPHDETLPADAMPARTSGTSNLADTYALFTGGRAVSENLQLDRLLRPTAAGGSPTVELDSITGITVEEIDWAPLIEDANPQRDPLAWRIPADQHAVFFPSFVAAVKMADEAGPHGTPVLQLLEPRSQDARTLQRYERQMCLTMDAAARLLGPRVAKSVALTGSDPYYRTGTDVAVLFESSNPTVLQGMLAARITAAAESIDDAKQVEGEIDGVAYRGARTPDRRLSAYVARLSGSVVVTNSLVQLERLVDVLRGRTESIASLDEYTFFRQRYARTDPQETALLFLSDAAIRRWCGPRWRIGASRRTREMAVIAELQAAQMDRLATESVVPGPIHTDLPISESAELTLGARGVSSSVHGSLAFMTPIVELPMDRVTTAEKQAYEQWRDRYQRNWRWSFDPIALRLGVGDQELTADLTVMPLIGSTDYRQFVAITRGVEFDGTAGDPHDALAHFIMSINTDSDTFRAGASLASVMAQGISLGWIGESVAVYVDDDPFWQELAGLEGDEQEDFLENNFHRLPIGVRVEVTNGLRLTAFLAGFRAFVQQSAPDMTHWELLRYRERSYVRVTATESAKSDGPDVLDSLALYYAPSVDSLLVTLSEDLLKRAIDRKLDRLAAETEAPTEPGDPSSAPGARPWLGSNLGLQINRKMLQTLLGLGSDEYQSAMQARAWGNIPILNEWKRRYPNHDPVELNERTWGVRLVCPGGGRYVWNEARQTMQSTVYGHPAAPQLGPAAAAVLSTFTHGSFGLTFEKDGLRARVSLERTGGE